MLDSGYLHNYTWSSNLQPMSEILTYNFCSQERDVFLEKWMCGWTSNPPKMQNELFEKLKCKSLLWQHLFHLMPIQNKMAFYIFLESWNSLRLYWYQLNLKLRKAKGNRVSMICVEGVTNEWIERQPNIMEYGGLGNIEVSSTR